MANPINSPLNNFGFAIDLSVFDSNGKPTDMGTPFDFFGPLAEPKKEDHFRKEGKLNAEQITNRRILRSEMQNAGSAQLPNEWWHFDAFSRADVFQKYKIV